MKKVLSILKWIGVMIIPLLAFIIAPVFYPIAYSLRHKRLFREKILWYFFDEEDGLYGAQYWKDAKGITEDTFWVSYRWSALRNPMWNLHTILVPVKGEEVIISEKGKLTADGKEIDSSNVAVLFYVDEKGKWSHNAGKYLSIRFSKLGKVFIWFKIKGKLYWRCSYAGNLFGNTWMEIQLGVGKRYTFRFKLKNVKVYEEVVSQ